MKAKEGGVKYESDDSGRIFEEGCLCFKKYGLDTKADEKTEIVAGGWGVGGSQCAATGCIRCVSLVGLLRKGSGTTSDNDIVCSAAQ